MECSKIWERLRNGSPFLGYQLISWLAWGTALWVYMDKVVPGAFRGAGDWGIMMGIHIVTANLTAFVVGPRVTVLCRRRRYVRAALATVLFLLGIAVFAVALSIALNAMTVVSPKELPDHGIDNNWQTLIVMFSGVTLGSLYYAALWMRQVLRLDKIQYNELEQRLQSALDEHTLEQLNGQLIPHLINNLMDTLAYTVKWRPQKVAYTVYAVSQFTKAYGRTDRDNLIPLVDELALVDLYIEVIHIRLGFRPHIIVDAAPAHTGVRCIPMLLILLVENMKKYAVLDDHAHPAVIRVGVYEGRLTVRATNRKRRARVPYSSQTGLRNLSDRLRLLWGEEACMEVRGAADTADVFSVNICCHTELFA